MSVTYLVKNIRFVPTDGATAERHPERLGTVFGQFHSQDGKTKLSITQKVIDKDTAKSDDFAIDLVKGTLSLPSGRRGRVAAEGISVDELNSLLNSLRS